VSATLDGLAALIAKDQIRDVIARYCRAIDRLDADLMLSCYHPDAVDEIPAPPRTIDGGAPQEPLHRASPAEFVAWVMPLMRANYLSTSHNLNNQLIELIDIETAQVETYYSAVQVLMRDGVTVEERIQGRYIDRVTERAGDWKIAHRRVLIDSYNMSDVRPWKGDADPSRPYMGRRDQTDYVYQSLDAFKKA